MFLNKYRIFCKYSNQWEYTWSTVKPTVCPKNETHDVNSGDSIPLYKIRAMRIDNTSSPFYINQEALIVNTDNASVVLNLPKSARCDGLMVVICKESKNNDIIINAATGDLINGKTSCWLRESSSFVQVKSDGVNWSFVVMDGSTEDLNLLPKLIPVGKDKQVLKVIPGNSHDGLQWSDIGTDDVVEGNNNLFFTNERVDSRISLQKGAFNGLASLNSSGKIPLSELELDYLDYQGTWNATNNVPVISSGVGVKGHYYVVSHSGINTIDGENDWVSGDWIMFNGNVWQKSDHTSTVTNVAGKKGAVILESSDITDLSTSTVSEGSNLYHTEARVDANTNVSANTTHRTLVNEHLDWTADQGVKNIHDGNVTASSVTQHLSTTVVPEGSNLYHTEARVDSNTNVSANTTHRALANEHLDWTADQGVKNIHDNNVVASSVTQHVGSIDHGSISGLADDDHPQYPLLAGRSGGQTIKGGTLAGNNLILESTSHVTKGKILVKNNLVVNDQGYGSNTFYNLSIQSGNAFSFMQLLNNGGNTYGCYFGMVVSNFNLYNWQGGPIKFYTAPTAASGLERLSIGNDGKITIPDLSSGVVKCVNGLLSNETINTGFNKPFGTSAGMVLEGNHSGLTSGTHGVTGAFVGTTDTQTLSAKTLTAPVLNDAVLNLPKINDTSQDHKYLFAVSELIADRIITLPLLPGNDTFVFENHTQSLLNKTLDSTTNTITSDKLRSSTTTVDVSSSSAPSSGYVLTATSGTAATWQDSKIHGNLHLDMNTLSSTDTNGNINILPNGTGEVLVKSNPVSAFGVVTKQYADLLSTGLTLVKVVKLKTTSALPAYTQAGTGTGATLTADVNGAIGNIDGVSVIVNDRVLVDSTGSTSDVNNGIYDVTQLGDGSNPWILTRSSDTMISGLFVLLSEGVTWGSAGMVLTVPGTIVVDTTELQFTRLNKPMDLTASNVGVAGVSVFKQKNVLDFEFKSVNAGSSRVSITDDIGNNEIDIDVVENNVNINNLSGAPSGSVMGTTDVQSVTYKTISDSTNTIGANEIRTTGASVTVDTASPPTTGQTLIATSATSAHWANASGDMLGPGSALDQGMLRFNGTTGKIIESVGIRHYGPSATNPTSPTPQAGDKYYSTVINEEMCYDSSRSKWLSLCTLTEGCGKNGVQYPGWFYRRYNGGLLTATSGPLVPKGTLTRISFSTSVAVAHTVEVLVGGSVIATLTSGGAASASISTVNSDFNEGIMSFRSAVGSGYTSNLQLSVLFKLRV